MVQLQRQMQSSGLCRPLQLHILFWSMYLQAAQSANGLGEMNKNDVAINK